MVQTLYVWKFLAVWKPLSKVENTYIQRTKISHVDINSKAVVLKDWSASPGNWLKTQLLGLPCSSSIKNSREGPKVCVYKHSSWFECTLAYESHCARETPHTCAPEDICKVTEALHVITKTCPPRNGPLRGKMHKHWFILPTECFTAIEMNEIILSIDIDKTQKQSWMKKNSWQKIT